MGDVRATEKKVRRRILRDDTMRYVGVVKTLYRRQARLGILESQYRGLTRIVNVCKRQEEKRREREARVLPSVVGSAMPLRPDEGSAVLSIKWQDVVLVCIHHVCTTAT